MMAPLEEFSVVNAQAGVWRHSACGKHTASPAEHTCRTDLMEALEVSLAQAKADLQGGSDRA